MRILVADGDVDSLDMTTYALTSGGVPGHYIDDEPPMPSCGGRPTSQNLMLLDAALPQGGGLEVCRRVRLQNETPVIVLSERADDQQVTQAFRLGADDFVPRPFSARQLVARINALWRRRGTGDVPEPQREVRVGSLLLDVNSHEVQRHGHTTRLTPTEFRLLYILAINVGRSVVSSARLVRWVGV